MKEEAEPAAPSWLNDVLAHLPALGGGVACDCHKACTSHARYFNRPAVMDDIEDVLRERGGTPGRFNQEKVQQIIEAEWERATWQDSDCATTLGVAVTLIPTVLLAFIVWFFVSHHKSYGLAFLGVSSVYWLAAGLGGAIMGLYGFTHHFFLRTIEPTFTPWTLTKTLSGAVMGVITAAVVQLGLASYHPLHPHVNLFVLVAAFAGGFKEQWFLDALGSVRPTPKDPPKPKARAAKPVQG
ncbi:MAG: hypothetical protein ACP5QO_17960 [Clostridia bacterium]